MDPQLYKVVDYILNSADDAAVEVIISALKKRGERRVNFAGVNPDALARQMAREIQGDMGFSLENIRSMVRDMVVKVIHNEAPELGEDDVQTLLDAWVPEDPKPIQMEPLPRDVSLQMIKQFISYSTGTMSMTELERLEREIPGWKEKFFARFSDPVRSLIKYLVEGNMSLEEFWQQVDGLV
ncbi:MAG: hypothetical protein JXB03_13475 [Spirochaetales bacterium]|nr:hypothetical protein [Spirochaetales bacterium]